MNQKMFMKINYLKVKVELTLDQKENIKAKIN